MGFEFSPSPIRGSIFRANARLAREEAPASLSARRLNVARGWIVERAHPSPDYGNQSMSNSDGGAGSGREQVVSEAAVPGKLHIPVQPISGKRSRFD